MNRKFAIGCAVVLVVLGALVVLAIQQVPKLIKKGGAFITQAIADEVHISALEKAWQPPSATPDASWFPSTIGEWKLERSEPRTGIPEMKIDRAGQHATYRTGAGPIEVDVIPANDLEQVTLIARAEEAVKQRRQTDASFQAGGASVNLSSNQSNYTSSNGNRKHVRVGNGEHTRFWWLKGTLFIFRARDQADSETFPQEYLRAISSAPPPAEPKLERP